MNLSIDLETRSTVDLKRSGVYRYFEHPWTEVLCAAYAVDDGPIHGWTPGQPCPPPVREVVAGGGTISGWHVNFERQGWRHILGPKFGWPVPVLEQFRCTAAQAAAQALPRALEKAADVTRIAQRKDMAGAKLMQQMAKPRRRHKGEADAPVYWFEGDLERLVAYCKGDVAAERELRKRLKPLTEPELLLWRLDQLINDRGITIDLDLVADMAEVVGQHVVNLNARFMELTGIDSCTRTEVFKRWLATNGVRAPSLAKTVIDDVLRLDMPHAAKQAILTWQEASAASVRKLQSASLCTGSRDRARGLLLFHGASTGRWSGQLLQPQNFVRGGQVIAGQDEAIEWIRLRSAGALEFQYGNPLTVVSDCLRGIMTAAPGHELMAGDYKNIEARLTAWMSNNEAKLDQFRAQDAHPDDKHYEVYTLAAASIYNKDVADISKDERQAGKTAELALGFGGGVDALLGMARNYHVDIAAAWQGLWDRATMDEREHVGDRYAETLAKGNTTLPRQTWEAAQLIVRAWRRANKPTVATWDAVHSAAWHALEDGGEHRAGRIVFKRNGGFLWMILPSGRMLAYPTPAIENREVPWSDKRLPVLDREHKDMLTVLAFEAGKKLRYPFYPGITFQHSVQATARDILAHGMMNAEAAGYHIVMTVHDEVIAEIPAMSRDHDIGRFLSILCDLPGWAGDLPLLADGWRGHRYRKN